jgi:hypothetical protein
MTELLDLLIFKSILAWVLIVAALLALIFIPRMLGLNYLNGMLNAQITLFFNVLTIVGGMDADLIDSGRVSHFLLIEFSFLIAVLLVYRSLLRRRIQVMAALQGFFLSEGAYWLTGFIALLAVFNFVLAPDDGSSRISYMTESWFSLLKPFIQIATPLSYLGAFLLLLTPGRKALGYLLLGISILANIATGSKASFLLSLGFAYLAVRDLAAGQKITMTKTERSVIIIIVTFAALFALSRLAVSAQDLIDRFMLYGEATIMTYFSPDPTAACSNLSLFASMHRGVARLLGDPTAKDIDTLFGFALMIEQTGVNTFTGPNARLSAYFLCNFPGTKFIFGTIVVGSYLMLARSVFARTVQRPWLCALFYPFLLASLHGASQDFNLIMQDITILCALWLALATTQRSRRSYA